MTTPARLLVRGLWLVGALWAALLGPVLRAHDLKEMTAAARIHADRIELVIVMSPHMAAALLGDENRVVVIEPASFATLRPELEARAKKFCLLTTGTDPVRALAPAAHDVLLGPENEVHCFLTYPPATEGELRIAATVLDQIPPGYVVDLRILDSRRKLLLAKSLQRGDNAVTLPLAPRAAEASLN